LVYLSSLLAAWATGAEEREASEQVVEAAPALEASRGAPEQAPKDPRMTALVSRMVVKVVSTVEARAGLLEDAAQLGGFHTLMSDGRLVLKVPPAALNRMIDEIGERGIVLEKTLEREDLTQEIAALEGQLRSKREVLVRLRGFFDDSGVAATLRIERSMTDLVQEIERVRGRLRVLRERSRWARIEIDFEFPERDRIIYVSSPFEWLNSVGLDQFLRGF